VLLGAALLLAAGSIGLNVYQGSGGGNAPEAPADGTATIEQLRAAAEASKDDAGPWGDLAFAYFGQGQYAEAAAAYRRAVQIAPDGISAAASAWFGSSWITSWKWCSASRTRPSMRSTRWR